jgi:hypothetical protein
LDEIKKAVSVKTTPRITLRLNGGLYLLHGAHPRGVDLVLIYGCGILSSAGVTWLGVQNGYSWWQAVLLFSIALDIFGGVVANGTRSTNTWYVRQPPVFSYGFLAAHALQPLLVAGLLPGGSWPLFWFLYLYALVAGSLVVRLRPNPIHMPLAMALLVTGFLFYTILFPLPLPISWFGYAFFTKLIVGFAVDHYQAHQSTGGAV